MGVVQSYTHHPTHAAVGLTGGHAAHAGSHARTRARSGAGRVSLLGFLVFLVFLLLLRGVAAHTLTHLKASFETRRSHFSGFKGYGKSKGADWNDSS
jgi:hypothetical protein